MLINSFGGDKIEDYCPTQEQKAPVNFIQIKNSFKNVNLIDLTGLSGGVLLKK